MKIKTGKKLNQWQALVIVLIVLLVLSGTAIVFGNSEEEGIVYDEREIDCIEYVRRGCCEDPNMDRCKEDEVGWTHDQNPHTACCDPA